MKLRTKSKIIACMMAIVMPLTMSGFSAYAGDGAALSATDVPPTNSSAASVAVDASATAAQPAESSPTTTSSSAADSAASESTASSPAKADAEATPSAEATTSQAATPDKAAATAAEADVAPATEKAVTQLPVAASAPLVSAQAAPALAPQSVGEVFVSSINVGGTDIPCTYQVITENGTTGTVQIGDGLNVAISASAAGALTIPSTVTHGGIAYTVTVLSKNCFKNCTGLTATGLSTNATVTSLGENCFMGCTGLTSTGLGTNATVASLDANCFTDCTALVDTGLATNSKLTTVGSCFVRCTSLTSTGLGTNSTVTTLGGSFTGCTSLIDTGLSTNTSVADMNGWFCFAGCTSLTSTGLGSNATMVGVGPFCFSGCSSLVDTGLATNSTPTGLSEECFTGCTALVDTGLGTNTAVVGLGPECFEYCTSLTSTGLATNSSVTEVWDAAFNGCTSLTSTGLETNSTVTTLSALCFVGTSTEYAAIGAGVTTVGYKPFITEESARVIPEVCYYGAFAAPEIMGPTTRGIYRLSEASGWTGKTAFDFPTQPSFLKSLSRLSIVGGTTASAPTQNHWTALAGTATYGRWTEGDTAQLAANIPAGYHFTGWTTTDGTGKFDNASKVDAVYTVGQCDGVETATVTAQTAANAYTTHFDANAADTTGTMADQSRIYDDGTALTANAFARAGYTFAGWNTAADGTGTAYADGAVANLTDANGAAITLYAQWTKNAAPGTANIVVTKSADKNQAAPNGTITYTITVSNNGTAASEAVPVRDYVPANTTYLNCDDTGTYGVTTDGKEYVDWTVASLAHGASKALTLTVTVNECQDGTGISNTALWGSDYSKTSSTAATTVNKAAAYGGKNDTAAASSILPKTGDVAVALPLAAVALAAFAIILVALRRRKED